MSTFTVHCSLQTASGRMFVHAREHDNPSNMRYMGLTVGKYIPDMTKAQSESWTGASLLLTSHATILCLAPEHLAGAACLQSTESQWRVHVLMQASSTSRTP